MASKSKRKPRKSPASSMLDLEFLRGLIDAIDQSGIDSLEITRAGTRIRVSKTPPPAPVSGGGAPVTHIAATPNSTGAVQGAATPGGAAGAASETGAGGGNAAAAEAEARKESNLIEVESPMVGTFYRAPSPEATPYVEVGSQVRQGQTLCILEAMKLMNELEAEVDGTVREILVGNAEPVEYGQVLFLIEPSS